MSKRLEKAIAKAESASVLAHSTPNTNTVRWHAKAEKAWRRVVEIARSEGDDNRRAGAAARAAGHVEAAAEEKIWRKFKPGLSVNDREAVQAVMAQIEGFSLPKRLLILKAATRLTRDF